MLLFKEILFLRKKLSKKNKNYKYLKKNHIFEPPIQFLEKFSIYIYKDYTLYKFYKLKICLK